jgi:hypothetical protein
MIAMVTSSSIKVNPARVAPDPKKTLFMAGAEFSDFALLHQIVKWFRDWIYAALQSAYLSICFEIKDYEMARSAPHHHAPGMIGILSRSCEGYARVLGLIVAGLLTNQLKDLGFIKRGGRDGRRRARSRDRVRLQRRRRRNIPGLLSLVRTFTACSKEPSQDRRYE